ncbi:MAG TPA: diacylglycerol kinase family protein [Acidimicrobiia bacterium]|nr:diacylglycerol kinase family protein [Acidimicrobiia bacterium]
MRLLLIVNETATAVTARRRVLVQRVLGADHKLEVEETSRRGHAARIARGAALEGVDVVVVLGGDGTLSEAADGLAGSTTALAPLPGGSTNVFARSIGVAYDPVQAAERLAQSLDRRRFERVGLGVAEGRRFLFHAGLGFDAAVIARVERRSFLKRYGTHPLFVAATIDTWLRRYDRRRPRFRVELGDGESLGDSAFTIVSNQRPWAYLGKRPLMLAPHAGLDVPLTVTLFRSIGLATVLGGAAAALNGGQRLMQHPKVLQRRDVRSLTVVGDGPFPWQIDGDYLGDTEHLTISWMPDALTIVMPP